jgi:putative transcriptional regulator
MPSDSMDLRHQLLIAMPAMADPNFSGSVVYICDHSDRGALGLVINRPTELSLSTLFDRIDLKLEIAPWKDTLVYFGGPVQTERGFVLHVPPGSYSSTLPVTPDISLTTSKDVLEAVAEGIGPQKMLVTLGYSGWGAGQLEGEIAANAWLTVTATPQILFDTPAEDRYGAALKLLGVDSTQLSGRSAMRRPLDAARRCPRSFLHFLPPL